MQPSCLAAVARVRESAAVASASAAVAVDATGAPGKLGQLSRKIAEKPRTHTPDPIRPDSIRVRLALFFRSIHNIINKASFCLNRQCDVPSTGS